MYNHHHITSQKRLSLTFFVILIRLEDPPYSSSRDMFRQCSTGGACRLGPAGIPLPALPLTELPPIPPMPPIRIPFMFMPIPPIGKLPKPSAPPAFVLSNVKFDFAMRRGFCWARRQGGRGLERCLGLDGGW